MSQTKIQKILILEDDKIQQLILKKKLSLLFPELLIFIHSTPTRAIDFLEVNEVDLIFLDLNLPEMSGWEIIDLLKKDSIESKLILVSGSVSEEDKERVKKDGFIHAIYEKPVSNPDLLEIFGISLFSGLALNNLINFGL